MKTRFLFPHHWRKGAIILIFLGIILAIVLICFYKQFTAWQTERSNSGLLDLEGIVESAVLLLLICGLLLFAFTKEEVEDEHLVQLRLDSLQWAVYSNYGLVIISILILNGSDLITVLGANVFTPLVIFILRFRWVVYQSNSLLEK
ncbi:hypothetical protein [Mucilaginibacter auburnensis]|uniref:hypothetical protein n=1 Tax=Mucilaginibacter auburnensis TaxID=1457233 RepID=UPI0012FD13D4|nr:hypothetical protein [Mucilaginibacter auburnensis]